MSKSKQQDSKEQPLEAEVSELFRDYQKTREQGVYEQQQAVMEQVAPSQPATPVTADSAEEQAVINTYREFASQRDGNRDEVIAEVTRHAKVKVEEKEARSPAMQAESAQSASSHWLMAVFKGPARALENIGKWIGGRLNGMFSGVFAGGSQWQLALPALAMVGMVLWLAQSTTQDAAPTSSQVAWGTSLPTGVDAGAERLIASLPPELPASFGFTAQTGELAATFELGMALADIELALAAGVDDRLPGMISRADGLAAQLGLPLLSAQMDVHEDATALNGIARRWFGSDKEKSAMYQLGFWMESARFALQLTESGEDLLPLAQVLEQLKEHRADWEAALQKHPVQKRQFLRLASYTLESLESYFQRQMYKRQLDRTVATFKNL